MITRVQILSKIFALNSYHRPEFDIRFVGQKVSIRVKFHRNFISRISFLDWNQTVLDTILLGKITPTDPQPLGRTEATSLCCDKYRKKLRLN